MNEPTEVKWTNSTLRKRLGETGFIETDIDVYSDKADYTMTVWDRNGYQIVLHEHRDGIKQPFLFKRGTNVPVSPDNLGVRNVNIQGDG